ncbi:uncharacterized protein LOC113919938 isoform X2 [Zalophus californianus]|uniref:Uncharacterized protein LOC113919938 isoform X2 n=1 Tax=Zalophus californianus TaxID=9704 RepID=A0A6J2CUI3_ZALCA|nr:uncharacterized protein LOC113919938 isoform X2 [Zalophus californianus]
MFLHLLMERNLYKTQVFRHSKRWQRTTWKGPPPEADHDGTLMVEFLDHDGTLMVEFLDHDGTLVVEFLDHDGTLVVEFLDHDGTLVVEFLDHDGTLMVEFQALELSKIKAHISCLVCGVLL